MAEIREDEAPPTESTRQRLRPLQQHVRRLDVGVDDFPGV
jgi:hypothetical protein